MNNYEGSIHAKESINSYWCPDCGNRITVRTDNFIRFKLEYEHDVEIMSANTDFYALCTKCDSYMLPIDHLLIEQINVLNANGIVTMYCCAGHLNMYYSIKEQKYKYYIELPYISFANIPENNEAQHIAKTLLSFQEYGFIEYEEDNEKWTIRAKICDTENFSTMRNTFINMVSELTAALLDLIDSMAGD